MGQRAGFIGRDGIFHIPPDYQSAYGFSEGLAVVQSRPRNGPFGSYGFINRDGRVVVDFQFEFAMVFTEGLAPVVSGRKYGFIDQQGRLVIPAQFDTALEFRGAGRWSLSQGALFRSTGRAVFSPSHHALLVVGNSNSH